MSIILEGRNLVKSYGAKKVVKDVSIRVEQGKITGLLGPNGAGKTTTFYMIVGLIKPNSGRVFINNEDITQKPMYKRAQKGIGYLAQEASVFRKLTVEQNIKGVLEFTKLSKKEQEMKCDQLIEEFSLQHVRNSNGDVLSGGERRRTEIARSLAVNPNFILLDEPFAGVDPIAVEDIQTIVHSLKEKNIGILITDHNVQQTLAITDHTYIMFEGKILKDGVPEELANDELVRRVYLGQNFTFQQIKDNFGKKPKHVLHLIGANSADNLTQHQWIDEKLRHRPEFGGFSFMAGSTENLKEEFERHDELANFMNLVNDGTLVNELAGFEGFIIAHRLMVNEVDFQRSMTVAPEVNTPEMSFIKSHYIELENE